ncbi:LLM class flavin-dependent oxidoreductase [Corynebacterium sp. A21]|uniref:LLM class flavin-dependent oxidoreductase n=1 Tax=Corynebacterium sp. A21 TaxID=3457318 RepID=UPI003FD084BE
MSNKRTLAQPFLAFNLDGEGDHPAAGTGADDATHFSGKSYARRIRSAETAGFHAITIADGPLGATADSHPARLAAIHTAAFAAPLTRRAALVPVVDAVFTEPFHTATQLMTLDHVSNGRAGWLVYGTGSQVEAASVGREAVDGARVKREVIDAVEVARRTWDSWEDDAEIREVESGRFIDKQKVHYVDFQGENYSVKGPSITPRSPQGQLPVIAPIELIDLAGERADIDGVLVRGESLIALIDAVGTARAAGFRIVIAEIAIAADSRGESGADRVARLDAIAVWEPGTVLLTGAAPDVATQLAEVLAVADGVRLHPAEVDTDLGELAHAVLPVLREQTGIADLPLEGSFRSILGLERPLSRYATAASKEN